MDIPSSRHSKRSKREPEDELRDRNINMETKLLNVASVRGETMVEKTGRHEKIEVVGACENNLKSISVSFPRRAMSVVTGVSGSGKSSLVFDTLFVEAQRQYLESLSTYARKSLPRFGAANVEAVSGLSPCVVIDQTPLARNPRSTVGTVTEIYTYLRLLFSRMGEPRLLAGDFSFNTPSGACERCAGMGTDFEPDLDQLIDWNKSLTDSAVLHRRWEVGSRYWNIIRATGRLDMEKPLREFTESELEFLLYQPAQEFQNKTPGYIQGFTYEGIVSRMIKSRGDARGLKSNEYNDKFFRMRTCSACGGARVNARARSVRLNGKSIVDYSTVEMRHIPALLAGLEGPIAEAVIPAIKRGVSHLVEMGLGYLTLSRSVDTLSSGESQRVKLARQLGSSLIELLYLLDEPTIGLHARDTERFLLTLRKLVDRGNTVVLVEHDLSFLRHADYVIDLGPGAGTLGGQVVGAGTPSEITAINSATGDFLSGRRRLGFVRTRRQARGRPITILHAHRNNLKDVSVEFPRSVLVCITGVSGAGKSSLVEVLCAEVPRVVLVDQTGVGSSPRSVTATYVGVWDNIRGFFSEASHQPKSLFSFNGDGACDVCGGLGYEKTDMHFLGDVKRVCAGCGGKRFGEKALSQRWRGKSIAETLDLTVTEALDFFEDEAVRQQLRILVDVGLGYLRLGQPLDTLSGGESQRVKLASRLGKGGQVYILDEPTRGLHPADIEVLLTVIDKLVEAKNTVIVVEHNLDVVVNSDWVIDLGPEGGDQGGEIVAVGTPEAVAENERSVTGRWLKKLLEADNGEVTR